jgi:hypothetical protein
MGIINNQGVFIAPPLGEGEGTALTSFREDDDFSTDLFDESINLPSFPNNIGIAFVRSSDSPADYATIALQGTNTSTIYVDNTAGSANLDISGDLNVRGASKFNVENSASLTQNYTLTFELTSNTNLTISARGSDGQIRSANITLGPP